MKKKTYSPFASSLRRIIDEAHLFTRSEWARLMGITQPAMSQWLCDQTIPRAELLRIVRAEVFRRLAPDHPILVEFLQVMDASALEVSPHGARVGKTFGHYAVEPLFVEFQREYGGLTAQQQENVMWQVLKMARGVTAEQNNQRSSKSNTQSDWLEWVSRAGD